MPREGCSVMNERLRSVARLLDGEGMTEVCRAFGIEPVLIAIDIVCLGSGSA